MSYYEWVKTFEELKTSPIDYNIIQKLEGKKLDGNEYVLDRLVNHVIETINTRLNNKCTNVINKLFFHNIDIDTISLELINFKKEKDFVLKIVNLKIFVQELRETFIKVINKTFDDIYNTIKRKIQYIDENGQYLSIIENIMISNTEV